MDPETIKIVCDETESGYMIINKADFDPVTMIEFSVEPTVPEEQKSKTAKGGKKSAEE